MVLKVGAIGRSPQLFLMDGAQGVCLLSVLRNGDADTQQHKDCRRKCSIYSHGLIVSLREMGFCTAALALTDRSVSLDYPELKTIPRLALIMGTEGDGLPDEVIAEADYVVRIPMYHGVDSLNVAAASAVAFWELRYK